MGVLDLMGPFCRMFSNICCIMWPETDLWRFLAGSFDILF